VDSLWTLHGLCADLWSPHRVHKDRWGTVKYRIFKVFDLAWTHHAKAKWAQACSKSWWDVDCNWAKASAMTSDLPDNWMAFMKATRKAKCKHFDEHTNEINHTNL
jgi:hypothetical protein